jgi:Fur family transcriptional regulator, ferric uptake regulator
MVDVANRTRQLKAALRVEGIRMTHQRATLLGILAAAEDHPDANELHRRVQAIDPSVSLSTVYRTLSVLERQGVVQRHTFEGALARFETADVPHHDHLIDLDTGKVLEFRSEKIERLQAEIAAELGYDLVRHRLELYCRQRERATQR